MLSVLLKILIVLGIILLVLLGIILFLILIILFLPITYRAKGRIEDLSDKEVDIQVNWLFGMLRFKCHYMTAIDWQLKFLWMDLKKLVMKKKTELPSEPKSPNDDTDSVTKHTLNNFTETSEEPQTSEEINNASSQYTENLDILPGNQTQENTQSKMDKMVSFRNKIKDLCEKITYYINLLQEDDTKNLFGHILKVLGKILKSIRPRKLKANAVIGFDSPDTTGKMYGFICMLYPYYGNDIHIIPDFEQSIIKGDIFIKGCIYIIVIVIGALRILLDRKFFKVIHKFKNGGTSKNGR